MRFEFALMLLRQGRNVLMHDADVFYRNGAETLVALRRYVEALPSHVKIIASDNGKRETMFDGLNWGFVWLRAEGGEVADLLECTLANWDNGAFQASTLKSTDGYYARSQPRINHILEDALRSGAMSTRSVVMPPKTWPKVLYRHMTGYPDVEHKIVCAMAERLLEDTRNARSLAYMTPMGATPMRQLALLHAALSIAESEKRLLRIPRAFDFDGKAVGFCLLFDVAGLLGKVTGATDVGDVCNATATQRCIDEDELSQMANRRREPGSMPKHVCDPHHASLRPIHCCDERTKEAHFV